MNSFITLLCWWFFIKNQPSSCLLCLSRGKKKRCQEKSRSIGEINHVRTGHFDSLFAEVWGEMKKKSSPEKISCPDFYLHSGWLALLKNDQYWLKNLWTMPSIRGTLLPSSITNWFPFKELVLSQTPIWKSNKILSICGSPLHNYSNPVGNMWLEERNCVSEFFLMLPKLYLFKLVIKIFLQHH